MVSLSFLLVVLLFSGFKINLFPPKEFLFVIFRPSDFLSISLTTNNEAHKTKINTSSDYYSTLSLTETNYFQAKDNSPKTSNFIITTTTNKHNHITTMMGVRSS